MRVLVALLASLTLVPVAAGYTRVPALEQAASEVAGRPVEVRCPSTSEWPATTADPSLRGFTRFKDGAPMFVALRPDVCWTLILLVVDPDGRRGGLRMNPWVGGIAGQGAALLTLAHEAVHMTGLRDEGLTECRALAHLPEIASKFGARTTTLVEYAYDAHARLPAPYRTYC